MEGPLVHMRAPSGTGDYFLCGTKPSKLCKTSEWVKDVTCSKCLELYHEATSKIPAKEYKSWKIPVEEGGNTIHMQAPLSMKRQVFCGQKGAVFITTREANVNCLQCLDAMQKAEATRKPSQLPAALALPLPKRASYKDAGGVSIKNILEAKLTDHQLEGYYLGCALDYLLRANFKEDGAKFYLDVEKASDYLTWLLETNKG